MEIGERIKMRRKELGLSADQVAESIGVSRANYYRYESADIEKLPSNVLIPLAKVLHCTPQYLIGWEDDLVKVNLKKAEPVREIPIYGNICCGNGLFVDDEIVSSISVPVAMLPNKSAEYFAQYAQGDSMTGAGIHDGDLIVFEKTPAIDPGQIGCFCIDENEAVCKKYTVSNHFIVLLPANDKYDPITVDPVSECFKVIGRKVLTISK